MISALKILGPGILTASAAIGTSHLIQATRAGAYFGFELLLLIIAINIIKYPFIECGYRYTASTGNNLIAGYKKLHKNFVLIFILISLISSFIGIAAVSYICAGILEYIFNTGINNSHLSIAIIAICATIIIIGHYKVLDFIMKILISILLIATIIAVTMLTNTDIPSHITHNDSAFNVKHIPFMLALMGWMPGPIELSVWHSLWLEARNNNNAKNLSFEQAKTDFNIGYFITVFTSILFLILGATILHNSGERTSNNATVFAGQLISIYYSIIGEWSKNIISIIVTATIITTTLTLIDIYPRTLTVGFKTIKNDLPISSKILHNIMVIFCCFIASMIIIFSSQNFKILLDCVTIIAFLSAPIFAYMNYKLLHGNFVVDNHRPGKFLKILSWAGLVYLSFFCILFFYSKFF